MSGALRVPLTDVAWQHRQVHLEILAAITGLLADVACDGVPLVHRLEQAFAAYCGDPWEAVSAQSGTAAQFLLLKALGIGPGDEVITVPNSDVATTAAITHAGARFVLVDVRRSSFNMDPDQVAAKITSRTRAILPVHMYGHPADMVALRQIADRHGLLLIEDATLALGARLNGRLAGTLGDGAFFSFAPRKVLGGAGNGGMVVTRDPAVANRVRTLRGYGLDPAVQDLPTAVRNQQPGQMHVAEGYNLKFDPMQAAVVAAKLPYIDVWNGLRRAAAARYTRGLAGCPGLQTPTVHPGAEPAWRNYVVHVEDREGLRQYLHSQSIATAVLYSPPVHLQPVYQGLGLGPGAFPDAEFLGERLLCLPIYPGISDEQVDFVVEAVRHYQERRAVT